jgi:GNAT superfamily N-acetyltransferase
MFLTRAATAADKELLAQATLENLNWNAPRFTVEQLHATGEFAHYFESWPGPRDFGLVAETTDGKPVGVVWVTHFTAAGPGYGFVAEDIPELSIWVDEPYRGQGVGKGLLGMAAEMARDRGLRGISLSVEEGNPAARLYERQGYVQADGRDAGCKLLLL